jgi:hypothetical protein
MDNSAPPPAYNSPTPGQQVDPNNTEALPPPNYTPPTKFTIGSSTTTQPLVRIVEVKGHLALLHAFSELKNQVDALEAPVPHVPADKERKWAWFVALAVERCVIFPRFYVYLALSYHDNTLDSTCGVNI